MSIVGLDKYRHKTFVKNMHQHLDDVIKKAQRVKKDIDSHEYAMTDADMMAIENRVGDIFTPESKELFLISSLANFFIHMSREVCGWNVLLYDNLCDLMAETNQEICNVITLCQHNEDFFPDKILS